MTEQTIRVTDIDMELAHDFEMDLMSLILAGRALLQYGHSQEEIDPALKSIMDDMEYALQPFDIEYDKDRVN